MKTKSILFLLSIFMLSSICHAQEPTHWRGPEGNGTYPDNNLLNQWPDDGPEILWSFESLGEGHSSAAGANDFIYTTGMIDEIGYLFKLSLSGELIYKTKYGSEFTESYTGPRGTPVIAGEKVYLVSGEGVIYCLNAATGTVLWKRDMVKEFGGEVIRWGYNETPVVDGNIIYCTPGGSKNNIVALNRHDGSVIWTTPGMNENSAYCTPLLFTHNGRKILATHTADHLIGVNASDGKLLWSMAHENKWSVHANTPIYSNGELFYFSGYGKGSGKVKISSDGTSISKVWENETLDSRMGGAVLIDGYIYGSGDTHRAWTCVNWATGENTYESTDIAKGPIISADKKLNCYSERGELAMLKANPEKFEILSKTKVELGSGQHWAHPMIYKGVLFVRHGKALIAYKIK